MMSSSEAPYFSHVATDNQYAEYTKEQNRLFLSLIDAFTPDPEADNDSQLLLLTTALGVTRAAARDIMRAATISERFPRFMELARSDLHIDKERIIAVEKATCGVVDTEILESIDDLLVELSTPHHHHEVLRRPQAFSTSINRALIALDPDAVATRIKKEVKVSYGRGPYTSTISATLPCDEAQELREIIEKTQREQNCTAPEAVTKIFRQENATKVTLHLYPNEYDGLDLLGAGALTPEQTEYWLSRVKNVNLMYTNLATTERFFNLPGKVFLKARDGVCVFPGCDADAINTQMDHITNYNGTNTDPTNGEVLCQHHHNMKTDRRIRISILKDGAKKITLNDTTVVTIPEGPAGRWGHSFSRNLALRTARRRAS
ncbi:HNH endonuclease signature motif containing protein [Corynebacterium kutscheri]|nr:HNH endonuclease signature motif containing protein [Corynebacterium kutscheri]